MRKEGKVWLTGAGPGDAGMLTLKGLEVLKKAEVVIYDNSLGDGVLSLIPTTARRIIVGDKVSDSERIRTALSEEAGAGYRVVRLISGDPCFSGNGSSELRFLNEKGIAAEVVPGISETGILEYAGFPVFAEVGSSFITAVRYDKIKESDEKTIPGDLVRMGNNLLFLCQAKDSTDILQELLSAGMSSGQTVSLITGGTGAGRKIISAVAGESGSLLSTLSDEERNSRAVLFVGGNHEEWDQNLPLSGWKVVAAKAKGKDFGASEKLREYGAEVVEIPVYSNVQMKEGEHFKELLNDIDHFDWLLLPSPAAADLFFEKMVRSGKDMRCLAGLRIACTGERTARKLKEKGILADFIPSGPYPETFIREFSGLSDGESRILFPRNGKEFQELIRTLRENGNEVEALTVGGIRLNKIETIDLKKETAEGRLHCILFTSVPAVKGFAESAKGMDFGNLRAACIGAQTKAAAEAYGMKAYLSEKETVDGLADLVVQIRNEMR